jgi:hypothetical protein
MKMTISATDPHPRQRAPILDTEISYVDEGYGDTIVFLRGNPTSSHARPQTRRDGRMRRAGPHAILAAAGESATARRAPRRAVRRPLPATRTRAGRARPHHSGRH